MMNENWIKFAWQLINIKDDFELIKEMRLANV